jgi:hypothetical protein
MAVALAACSIDMITEPGSVEPPDPGMESNVTDAVPPGTLSGSALKGLGDLEVLWRGGNAPVPGGGDPTRRAFVDFSMHDEIAGRPTRGSFVYRVVAEDLTLHREVAVAIDGVHVDQQSRRLWFTGTVVSDSKGCAGGPGGGHDDGCTDEGCDDDGCGGHDGGCGEDHDTGDGGCTGDHDTTDGGCADDHDTTDGGCTGDHDTPGGGFSGGHGASGRFCRVGQRLVGKMHDGGSPGASFDGITWRWFLPDDPALPVIEDVASWPHLCRKDILAGNLTVFVPRPRGPLFDAAG